VDLAFTRWKPPPGEPKLPWRVTYGKAPIIGADGGRGFAEIELVRRLRVASWRAWWVDSFGQAPPDMTEWLLDPRSFPPSLRHFDETLGAEPKGAGRPDIFAWRGDSLADAVFVEYKGPGDTLGPGQGTWFRAALPAGMSRDQFAVAR